MSGGRWRLQHVDDDDSGDGFEAWQITKIDDEDSLVVLQAWDEAEARYAITALRWLDDFMAGAVSIPKPPAPRRKRTTKEKA